MIGVRRIIATWLDGDAAAAFRLSNGRVVQIPAEDLEALGRGCLAAHVDWHIRQGEAAVTRADGDLPRNKVCQGSDIAGSAAPQNPEPAVRSDSRSGPEGGSDNGGEPLPSEPPESFAAPQGRVAAAKYGGRRIDQWGRLWPMPVIVGD